jgi:hypothetical protein
MTITITIDDLPVEVQITHYQPPALPRGPYGYVLAAEVEWIGPDWLHAVANHFNLWRAIDRLVIEAINNRRKQGDGE